MIMSLEEFFWAYFAIVGVLLMLSLVVVVFVLKSQSPYQPKSDKGTAQVQDTKSF